MPSAARSPTAWPALYRATEVPTHYAPMIDRARRHGIPVPGLERLVAEIAELEAGAPMSQERIAGVLR